MEETEIRQIHPEYKRAIEDVLELMNANAYPEFVVRILEDEVKALLYGKR